jgi:hypothetical protein
MATTISGTSGITTPAETLGPAGLTFGDSTVQTTAATSPVAPVVTIYSSPATWTKSAILKAVKITLVAGGGSGGSTISPLGAGAGGNGGILYGYAQAPVIPGPVTVTAGAGGPAPGPNVAGVSGGTSSFGSVFSTTGGGGGSGGPSPSGNGASGGAYAITSTATTSSLQLTSPVTTPVMAYGVRGTTGIPATAGTGYGMGGGGSPGNAAGGAGSAGFVIVEEFY